jgi:hypothetical protein
LGGTCERPAWPSIADASRRLLLLLSARAYASPKALHATAGTSRSGPRHHNRAFAGAPARVLSCSDPSPEPDCCRTW